MELMNNRYVFFNNLLFDGLLPLDVNVYYIESEFDSNYKKIIKDKENREVYRKELTDYDGSQLGGWYDSLNSIFIFKDGMNEFTLDEVLVHEMCHVWQDRIWNGKKYQSNHAPSFQYIKTKIRKNTKGIYGAGAFIDTDNMTKDYNEYKFGNPYLMNYKKINRELRPFGVKLLNYYNKEYLINGKRTKYLPTKELRKLSKKFYGVKIKSYE